MGENFPPPPPDPPIGSEPPGGGWAEHSGPSGEKADSFIRLGARLLDALILLVPSILIAVIVGGTATFNGTTSARAWLGSLAVTGVQFAYYVVMESGQGGTLGKRIVGLKVYGAAGGLPTQDESAKRNAFLFLNLVPTFLGSLLSFGASVAIAVTISGDPLGRGWHDKFAGGTRVVRERS